MSNDSQPEVSDQAHNSCLKLLPLLKWIAGLILLCYFLAYISWPSVLQYLTNENTLVFIGCSSLLYIVYVHFRALRFYLLLLEHDSEVSFHRVLTATFHSLGFAIITPFQSGEIIKAKLLSQETKVPTSRILTLFLIERALDLTVVAVVGSTAAISWMYSQRKPVLETGTLASTPWVSILVCLMVLVLGLYISCSKRILATSRRVWQLLPSRRAMLTSVLLTIIAWSLTSLAWFVCLQGANVRLPFIQIYLLTHAATLLNVLSAIPGAVGVSEIGISLMLQGQGVTRDLADTGAISLRVYGITCLIVSGLWTWWRWHQDMNSRVAIEGRTDHDS